MSASRVGVAFGAACLCAAEAGAQALTAPNVGTSLSGPATADPAAVWWNPAMTAELDRVTALVGGALLVGDITYRRERRGRYQRADALGFALPVPPENVDPSRTGFAAPVRANPVGVVPTLFLTVPVWRRGASRVVVGVGVYAPYAAILQFDPDGAQRWALQSATIAAAFVTPTVAWRIQDVVSVGAGVSYVFGFAELARVVDFASLGDVGAALARPPISQRNDFGPAAPTGVRELDVLARPIRLRRMIAHAFTFHAGLAVRPTRGLTLSLAYQHATDLTFTGTFELDLDDPFFTRDLASQGLRFERRVEGDATLSFPLPRALRAAARFEVTPRVTAGLTAEFVTWSQVQAFDARVRSPGFAQPMLGLGDTQQLRLPRRWRDTVAVEGSVAVGLTPRVSAWALGGYHSSATPDDTMDVASPDGDRVVGALGARLRVDDAWTVFGDVEVQTILPRRVVASEHDLGNGEYGLTLVSVGAHVQRTF